MCIETKRINFRISFSFAVFLAVAGNVSTGRICILSMVFAFFHELIHIYFLIKYTSEKIFLRFSFGGIKMYSSGFGQLSYKKTIVTVLSAPIANIITGVVFYCLFLFCGKRIIYMSACINLISGLINLLPVSFLDGGRAFFAALSRKYDEYTVRKICDIAAVISLVFLFAVFVATVFLKKYALFLLFFFFYCTIGYIKDKFA